MTQMKYTRRNLVLFYKKENCKGSVVHHDILHALSDVIDVSGGETTDRDTAVLGHVDVMLLYHGHRLLERKSSEREHANLGGDVAPVAGRLNLFDGGSQGQSHLVDAIGNGDKLLEPLGAHASVVEDHGGDACTVLGRGGVVDAHDDLDLGEDAGGVLFVVAHEVERASTLTISPMILAKL